MDALPLLCLLLGVFCSLALAIDKAAPPEDLDASGDDEDFSGSGSDSLLVDVDSKVIAVYSTPNSTLVPTMEGSTAAQEPEIIDKEQAKVEDATWSTENKTLNPLIEDLVEVDAGDKEATTSPPPQTSTAEILGEIDTRKHHHHHPHPHHPTTSSTTLSSESKRPDDDTIDIPHEVKPHDLPVNTTASTPDESELLPVPREQTTPVEDLANHGVLHEDTTYVTTEEANVDPLDSDKLPALDSLVTTTVAEHTHKAHHHHHHHPHPPTTTSLFDESEFQEDLTTRSSDMVELGEGDVKEHTTTVAEDAHHPPHHHHAHHKSTPSTAESTEEPERPHEAHTHEPKGRRVHVPDVRSTTAVPVQNEEHLPDNAEKEDFPSSTVHYNVSRNPFDEVDDTLDSKEEGPSGVADQDIFFEATVPVLNRGISNDPISDEGKSGASQGIMERKELLAGIIAGGVAGLVFAASLVAFVLYRMKKKDEGSYSLEEPKQSNGGYQKPREQREFYA